MSAQYSVQMNYSLSTVSKRIKLQTVSEFLTQENETRTGIHRRLLAFCGENTVDTSTVRLWVIILRDSGGNLVPNDQPQSGMPVTATLDLNRQKFDESIQAGRRNSTARLT